MSATEQDVADLLIDQLDKTVVTGDGLQQRRRGMEVADILRLQNVFGLLDDVLDVGRDFRAGIAGDDLLHPARIQVDGVIDRTQLLGDQTREVADSVRPARHEAEQSTT